MQKLKTPEIVNNNFEANGRNYHISNSLSIDRYKEDEKLDHHVIFGADPAGLAKTLDEVFELLNKSKQAEAAVKIHNVRAGIDYKNDKNREHPMLYLCALFLNREDEDVNIYDQAISDSKIQDWKTAGIEMVFFFQLARSLIRFYADGLETDLKSISDPENKLKDTINK